MGRDNDKFEGWMGLDKNAIGNMVWRSYEPKPFEDNDVDIEITHSGICGSDLHTLRSGWKPTDYPCIVGHEIVGTAVRVGSKAEGDIRVGDVVGVGAQSDSCLQADCYECSHGQENHCSKTNSTSIDKHQHQHQQQHGGQTDTYNSRFRDGSKSYGGYARYWRGPSHFVVKIPDGLAREMASPMLCSGVTMYAALSDNGCGPGRKVGIVGIGGLGHFGLLFARALGADEVTAVSRTGDKREDAMAMGADRFIATDEEENWQVTHAASLDLLVGTVSSPDMPMAGYLGLLRTRGQLIQVGAPEGPIEPLNCVAFILRGIKFGASKIGPPRQIAEMLRFARDKKVRPWIQQRPMSEANQAIVDMENGLARYKYILIN